jgi:hypothetical protein
LRLILAEGIIRKLNESKANYSNGAIPYPKVTFEGVI